MSEQTPTWTAEDELRRTQACLRAVEQAGQIGVWEFDWAADTLTGSEEISSMLGQQPGQCVLTWESFCATLHPLDCGMVQKAILEGRKKPCDVEFRTIGQDGSIRWIRFQAELGHAPGGREVLAGTAQDRTRWRELQEQFRQAQKMEVLGRLAGGVAHDFNNLLTVMRGRSEMLLLDGGLTAPSAESLQQVIHAADRAAALARQLVAFSRKQPTHLEALDLSPVIKNVSKLLRHVGREDINIQMRLAHDLPLVQADAGMIEQLLLNLAIDAQEFMPAGGDLTITTDAVPGSSDLLANKLDRRHHLWVRLGIRASRARAVAAGNSDRWETLGSSEGASAHAGLGMNAVYSTVDELRGWVDISAQPQEKEFSVFLPAITGAAARKPAEAKLDELRGNAERILLAEADQGLRKFMGLMLQRLGYEVHEAATGSEAVRIWENGQTAFDLLLADLAMPGELGGLNLARQLREQKPDLKVVVVTGRDQAAPGSGEPGTHVLAKPFTPEAFAQAVRACLDGA